MKKIIEPAQTLCQLAEKYHFTLPQGVNGNTVIKTLDDDYRQADANALTVIAENAPAALYRCTAAAVLVLTKMANLPTRDEGVQIIPVDDPQAVFNKLCAE